MMWFRPKTGRTIQPRTFLGFAVFVVLALVASSCGSASPTAQVERVTGGPTGTYIVPPGIHKIKHVIVIQQENRSFDSYFGTFPGADGIPMQNGKPTVCVNDPATGACVAPYVDHCRRERRWTPLGAERDRRHRRREDGRLHRPGRVRPEGLPRPDRPGLHQLGDARRDGLPHRRATSRTTGPTPRTSSSRTTCSSRTPRGAFPPTCSWCRSGRRTAPSTTIRRAA